MSQKAKATFISYILFFALGFGVCTGVAYYVFIKPTDGTISILKTKLADAESEVGRLGTLVGRQDEIARREVDITRREREIADREADNNRRTKVIYSELRNIIASSLDDIDAIERIAGLVKVLEQNINH